MTIDTNVGSFPIFAVTTSGAVALACYAMTRRRARERRSKERRMSATSYNLAYGSFPPNKNVCEPIINGVLFFDDCPEPDAVADVVETLLNEYERFRGSPTCGGGWYCKEPEKTMDPASFVRTLEICGDDNDLMRTLQDQSDVSLTEHRNGLPWWECLFIKNYGTGMSACVLRIHHALADGLSIVSVLEKVLKNANDGSPIQEIVPKSMTRKLVAMRSKSLLSRLFAIVRATISCLSLPLSRADDDILFRKTFDLVYNGKRKCVLFQPVPLDFVKEIKTKAGVSLNDVIFACISQAIHDYCTNHRCPVLLKKGETTICRALIPSSVPTSGDTNELRNSWAFVSCDMGVGLSSVAERLVHIHERMNILKNAPPIQLVFQTVLISLLPISVMQKTAFDLFASHSIVFTNVPGPHNLCSFAGKTAISMQCIFPNLLPQVCVNSYAGNIVGNILFDPEVISNGEKLAEYYSRALVDLGTKYNVKVPSSLLD